MTTILVVDDQQNKRKLVIDALIHRYQVAGTNQPDQTGAIINKLQPSIILINRLSMSFNSINHFLTIKNQYPKIPVLLYALQCPDALKTLKQAISMALGKKRIITPDINAATSVIIDQILTSFPETKKSLQKGREDQKKLVYAG